MKKEDFSPMKKKLLLLSMVSGLTLVGCNGISPLDGENGQVIVKLGDGTEYTADDLFNNYSNTSAGASQYFEAVYDVLVRAVQPITDSIQDTVDQKLDDFVDSARSAASTNGTSYRTELSNALEKQGVESLDELEQVYYLDAQKAEFEEDYYEANDNENLNALLSEYIQYYAPYHVRHILIKTSSGTSLYNGTVSSDDAKSLAAAAQLLASGNLSFGEIALQVSDDDSSKTKYGETSIMSTTTSFVNEFKFALYQYDEFFNADAQEAVAAYDERQASEDDTTYVAKSGSALIPLDEEDKSYVESKVNRIPYEVFEKLNEFANVTLDQDGNQVKDGNEAYYPRNILFNKYLNEHSLGCIVRGTSASVQGEKARFMHVEGLSASDAKADDVLVDETGRPILVTRSGSGSGDSDSGYQGIFFIIAQRSPFVKSSDQSVSDLLTSLDAYWTMDVPASNADVSKMNTYVTYIKGTNEDYETRAENIETNVKGFDSHMNFRFYEEAYAEALEKFGSVTINDKVEELIDAYIAAARDTSNYSANETYQNAWDSYVQLLQLQDQLSSKEISEDQITALFDHEYQPIGGAN